MKRIAIVGTSSGIGKELVELLSKEEQLEIIAVSRRRPAVQVAEYLQFDVTSDNELPAMDGALDGLVYCPGSIVLRPFKGLTMNDFRADMEISFFGAVRMIRHFQPALTRSGTASVVLFSSLAAGTGMPYHSSIASAKAAIEGLVRSLAAELAPGIRINAIAPSLVDTPLAARLTNSEAKIKIAGERHPMKRIGTANEMAAAAAFLLSERSSWITGQVLKIDGGLSTIRL